MLVAIVLIIPTHGNQTYVNQQVAVLGTVSRPQIHIACRGMEDPHRSEAAAAALEAGMQLLERSHGEQKLAQSGLLLQSVKWLHSHSAAG